MPADSQAIKMTSPCAYSAASAVSAAELKTLPSMMSLGFIVVSVEADGQRPLLAEGSLAPQGPFETFKSLKSGRRYRVT
jgi:hypothetical protein